MRRTRYIYVFCFIGKHVKHYDGVLHEDEAGQMGHYYTTWKKYISNKVTPNMKHIFYFIFWQIYFSKSV